MDDDHRAIGHLIEELVVALIDSCDENAALGKVTRRTVLVLDPVPIVSLLFLRPRAQFIEG